jgi:peptide/nickel transport system substrate-binding protein
MKKLSKLLALLLALTMIFSVLSACSGSKDDTASSGGQTDSTQATDTGSGDSTGSGDTGSDASDKDYSLNIGVLTANGTHDPTIENNPRYQMRTVFECLLRQDPETGEIGPWLATSVEYIDELTIEVKLRDDVYFTDGQQMTAKDVFYTYKDHWAAGNQGSYFVRYDWDNSEIVDDFTIHFAFTSPYGPAITMMAVYNIFCYDDLFGDTPADADKWMYSPNGTGPYYCTANVDSAYVTYARKDAADYWGELPECTEVTYKFYSESTTMYIDFEQGALDAACAIATTDAERVLAGDAPSFTGYYVNSIRDILMIILPEETAIFDDIRVREAFFKSVDRENVAVAMFGPLFLEADSILPSSINFYQSQEVPEYDPDGAKELLAEAGYPDGISLRLIVTQDMQVLAEALQASLATGGITCSVESYDIGTAIPMLRDMESDFICKQAEGGAFINEPCLLLDTLSPESTLPPAGMTDETWSQYFYESIYTTSDEDRAEGYAGLQKWAAEEYRCLPVCERANMTVYNTDKLESFVLACADEPCAMYAKFK